MEDDNAGTLLLADIFDIFSTIKLTQLASEGLVESLVAIEGRPWAEFGHAHRPISKNKLARLLAPYKIRPGTIRTGPGASETAKGYKLADFADAFERYLAPAPNPTVTPSQTNETADYRAFPTVTPPTHVTDGDAQNARSANACDDVTDVDPLLGENLDVHVAEEEGQWTV
jgi:putative DNA primase/helicase